jgi:hypothetical protein
VNYITGRFIITFDESGAVTGLKVLSGRVVDVCAALTP